ncbi:MAG TPA: general secretion pathway protein GspB, partial [Burkholderiaceae bacterium]|nr:general secretion pathway protein GspB [Burkholderiaceae bacterium]
RVVHLHDLPTEVRRELPPIAIGGSVYSQNRSDRLVIINGRPFQEGERPAPQLTLESIQPKHAVFRFRDYLVQVPY